MNKGALACVNKLFIYDDEWWWWNIQPYFVLHRNGTKCTCHRFPLIKTCEINRCSDAKRIKTKNIFEANRNSIWWICIAVVYIRKATTHRVVCHFTTFLVFISSFLCSHLFYSDPTKSVAFIYALALFSKWNMNAGRSTVRVLCTTRNNNGHICIACICVVRSEAPKMCPERETKKFRSVNRTNGKSWEFTCCSESFSLFMVKMYLYTYI